MKIVDLSVPVNENTPAYPGDPHIRIEVLATYEKDTYNDHAVSFGIHSSGTHIDGPWHMVADGKRLDQVPLEQFIGRRQGREGRRRQLQSRRGQSRGYRGG